MPKIWQEPSTNLEGGQGVRALVRARLPHALCPHGPNAPAVRPRPRHLACSGIRSWRMSADGGYLGSLPSGGSANVHPIRQRVGDRIVRLGAKELMPVTRNAGACTTA